MWRSCTLAFLLGFLAIVGQVVFIRESLAVFQGNELFVTLVFVIWFAGISSGAFLGGRSRRTGHAARRLAIWLVALMPPAALVQVAGIRAWRLLVGIGPGEYISFLQGIGGFILFVFPFSFLVGLTFPVLAASMGPDPTGRNPVPAGMIYWVEAAGSLSGGVMFTFVFAGRLSSVTLLGVLWGASLLVLGWVDLRIRSWRRLLRHGFILTGLGVVVALLAGVSARVDHWLTEYRWSQMAPGYRLVKTVDSRYQNLALGEREGQYVLYLDGLLAVTFPDPYQVAQRVHLVMNQPSHVRDVLMIGQGLEGEVQTILEYPVQRVDFVFLDPRYPELVLPRLSPDARRRLEDPRLRTTAADAAGFLLNNRERYDLIIMHPPAPATAGNNRFYTREFFSLCRRHLRPGGVLVTGLDGAENFIGEDVLRYTGTLFRTLGAVFHRVEVAPGSYLVYLASDADTLSLDASELARRFNAIHPSPNAYFSGRHFRVLLPPDRVTWLRDRLQTSSPGWINTARHPVLYLLYLSLWDTASGSRLGSLLNGIRFLQPFQVLLVLLGLILAVILRNVLAGGADRRAAADRRLALLGMFVFGFLGMGLEVLLLYNFQSLYGYLYSMIGVLIALFMLGLTLGAWLTNRSNSVDLSRVRAGARWMAPVVLALLAVSVNAVFGTLTWFALPLLFLQILAAGVLTGLYFPLAARLYAGGGGTIITTASRMDAMDHLGALAGAGLTGAVLMPALGISGAVFSLAGLALVVPLAGAGLSVTIRSGRSR